MIDFVIHNFEWLVSVAVGLIGSLFVFIRTRSLSKTLKYLKECEEMRYKTVDTPTEHKQEFSETVPDYVLNPSTNELERLPVDKNVQEMIQSYIECALERALQRYVNIHDAEDQVMPVIEYERAVSDLADLSQAIETAEQYREEFDLPDSYSISQIYQFVDQRAKELKQQISTKKEDSKNGSVSSPQAE